MRLDIKRLNLPFVITSTCPRCGGEVKVDLRAHSYLSYPLVGEPFEHTLYHVCVDEEDRHEEDCQNGGYDHAAKHSGAECPLTRRTSSIRDDQRDHAQDERERGH